MLVGGTMIDLSIARPYIEMLYKDTCTVIELHDVVDPITHITSKQEVVVHENVPCKLSHHVPLQSGEGVTSGLSLSSYIILNPDLEIKAGSRIDVIRNGKTTSYKNSGEPAIHHNHQKIMLSLWDDYA